MSLAQQLEALLFYYGEPVSVDTLAQVTEASPEEVQQALLNLDAALAKRGIQLVQKENQVMLATHPDASELIEKARKEELSKDVGRAGMETLSIILYRAPITRAEIDYIRGVNSTFILRHLLVRGLIERLQNPNDQRSYVYQPTFDLLSYLGIRSLDELPDYRSIQEELAAFANRNHHEDHAGE